MNILFVFDVPIYKNSGGVERITDTLTERLVQQGHTVKFLARNPRQNVKGAIQSAPQFIFPSTDIYDKNNVDFYHNFVKGQRIDIVINQNGAEESSYLFCEVPAGVKLITVNHTYPMVNFYTVRESLKNLLYDYSPKNIAKYLIKGFLLPFRCFIEKKRILGQKHKLYSYILDKSDKFIVLSPKYIDDIKFVTDNERSDYNKLAVIPNVNSYSKDIIQVKEKKKQILYVGRFTIKEKRPDRVLKIWKRIYKQHPDWELILIGGQSVEYEKYLRRYIRNNRLQNVCLMGEVNPMQYYQNASISCLVSNYEGFGLVLSEAMQCSTVPVVFNSFGAASDIIEDGENGFLIEPFNYDEFAEKLSYLMTDRGKRELMANKAKASVTRFDFENVYPQWEELIN